MGAYNGDYRDLEKRAFEKALYYRLSVVQGREYRRKRRLFIQGKRRRGWKYYTNGG